MRLNRKALLGTVAAVALGGSAMGMSSDAQALEQAWWNWDLYIDTNVLENITIDVNWDPIGKVIDQVVQIQLGDVTADSHVTNVYNWKPLQQVEGKVGYTRNYELSVDGNYSYDYAHNQARSGSRSSSYESSNSFDGQLHGNLTTSGDGVPFFIGGVGTGTAEANGQASFPPLSGSAEGTAQANAAFGFIGAYATEGNADVVATADGHLNTSGSRSSSWASEYASSGSGSGSFSGYFGFTESDITNFYALVPAIQDAAAELPKVSSTAFAAGNVISIEGDVGVQEHSLQVTADVNCHNNTAVESVEGDGQGCHPNFTEAEFSLDTNYNINHTPVDLATQNNLHNTGVFFAGLGITGIVKKADITATSYVDDILNAQVDSSATAFGNYKSINIDTGNPYNGIAWADATQVSIADVSAYSSVGGGGVFDPILASDELSIQPRYVGGIHLVNYTGLGGVDIAKSTATAIGNVLNVKVGSGQGPGAE